MRSILKAIIPLTIIAILGILVVFTSHSINNHSSDFVYSVFDRPQNKADQAAIDSYVGDTSIVSLDTARLLGSDEQGNQYLVVRDDSKSCLIVIHSAEASSGTCSYLGGDATDLAWIKIGNETGDRLAILVPDGYSVSANKGEQLVSETNLVVLQSSPENEVIKFIAPDNRKEIVLDTAG